MKNISLITLCIAMLLCVSVKAQIVFSNGFENWTGNVPDNWVGSLTTLESDSILQYTADVHSGSYACRLVNRQLSSRKFSSSAITLDSGFTYVVSYWVRGHGYLLVSIYNGTNTIGLNGGVVDSLGWIYRTGQLAITTSTSSAELVFTVKITNSDKDDIQIDDVLIYKVKYNETLALNNVSALFSSYNSLFWDFQASSGYEVPKGSGKKSLFASALWFGGLDSNNSLHLAAGRYRNGDDFFQGSVNNCSTDSFNYIWKINKSDIDTFIWHFYTGNMTGYTIPASIINWPASSSCNPNQAPYFDNNNNGIYNPYDGDYPCIKGDQMLWWVMNDSLKPHTETNGLPLGIEVHVYAWAYNPNPTNDTLIALTNTTFLRYEVHNLSQETYHDTYFGFWTDGDLGYYTDDYIGCNVKQNSAYCYNADNMDGDGSGQTYGAFPPVQAIVQLNGPLADAGDGIDNDRDSIIDETGEKILMSGFNYFRNSGALYGDPQTANEYYNFLQGFWRDGTPLTYGGTGYEGVVPTKYAYPGDSDPYGWGTNGVPQPAWWQTGASDDLRGVMSSGPFTLEPNETVIYDLAFVWSRIYSGAQPEWILNNEADVDKVTKWYNEQNIDGCSSTLNVKSVNNNFTNFRVYPNPCNNVLNLSFGKTINTNCSVSIIDLTGKTIYTKELKYFSANETISVANLDEGIYIVKVITNNEQYNNKFVKK